MYKPTFNPNIVRKVSVYILLNFVLVATGVGHVLAGTNAIARGFDLSGPAPIVAAQSGSPTDVVRDFYRLMREKKFREAFALSIYQPAIEGLKPAEFDDLRPDFERLASAIPEKVDIGGEQISGESATVFVKVKNEENKEESEPVALIRFNGKWIVGDQENFEIVKKAGGEFFFNARIDTHHKEVQALMQRIALSQLVYSQQHAGKFGDMPALILAGLIAKDLEGTESTGYRFRINVAADGKSWTASAEPAQYGRSGRLSYFLDKTGLRNGDVGGKPLPQTP